MWERKVAKFCPQGIAGNVRNDNWLPSKCGGAAGANVRSNFRSVYAPAKLDRKTGGSSMAQCQAVSVEQENRTQNSGIMLLDLSAQSVHYLWQRTLAHDHRQHRVVEQRQCRGMPRGFCR